MEGKITCWWAAYRDWYFALMTLSTPYPLKWDPIYSSGKYAFRSSDIAGNFDEVEERLFAVRNGL